MTARAGEIKAAEISPSGLADISRQAQPFPLPAIIADAGGHAALLAKG